ncbi:GNAT family N-acetyltransferase [Bacillus sp. FJAT-49732]|uniref:GNAT family N-acetyltransferase n=1 Tax=Lederbergia citrisecunda TaxID=2833583 RepID=A0A942YMR3_9BACI|nr:GNAT family N-acetyltransferase [Lederbergia citrisecunda]MBS4200975.1 GNAT family N-acetyltransferase [Lederbergia citrisecunda]
MLRWIMNIEIQTIKKENYEIAHDFQCEYLDDESFQDFSFRVECNPDLYLIAMNEQELAGVCYGHPSNRDEQAIQLQGIAVNLEEEKGYARKGIGSKLIADFEKTAKRLGYKKLDLGSADDVKVEKFYLKNGFQPSELVAKNSNHEEYERVKIDDYETGKKVQEQLRMKYNPDEVIFIFQKQM